MAYIVMAYTVMAFIVMAYIAMAPLDGLAFILSSALNSDRVAGVSERTACRMLSVAHSAKLLARYGARPEYLLIVSTYIVMAYIVMPYKLWPIWLWSYIVMTYITMAYIVMAYIVMAACCPSPTQPSSWLGTARRVLAHRQHLYRP